MIDWQAIEKSLSHAASRQTALICIRHPLPAWPAGHLEGCADWFYWRRPAERLRLIALGSASRLTSQGESRFAALASYLDGIRGSCADALPHLALGFSFWPETEDPDWPNLACVVPELMLLERDGQTAAFFSTSRARIAEALSRWRMLWRRWRQPCAAVHSPALPRRLIESRAEDAYLARVRSALAAIAGGEVVKVVLAHRRRLMFSAPPQIDAVLAVLAEQHPHCAIYGARIQGRIFVGASPERLLAQDGRCIRVDVLAGTHWPGSRHALDSAKSRHEHALVALAIEEALAPFTPEIVADPTTTMYLNELSHLYHPLNARLPDPVACPDLLAALHPTPAVGGYPRHAALSWLLRHAERRPAWYSGGIGWIDPEGRADIAVALRCGLVVGQQATLFAGAGIVAGSQAEDELAEVDAKFALLERAFEASAREEAAAA
ncbi:MAG: isochorismate synthase [Rhodocyclaceae bacterium]|nr:isochorismate synthase [Rhodocyclaceae bacterium]